MIAIKGFNFDLKYQKTQKIELVLNQEFKNSEVKEIAKEILENQPIMIEKVEVFEDTVAITTTKITEEQKANLITKINEKYGTQLNQEATNIIDVAHKRFRFNKTIHLTICYCNTCNISIWRRKIL